MSIDWYQVADVAVRVAGGLLVITSASLLIRASVVRWTSGALKRRAIKESATNAARHAAEAALDIMVRAGGRSTVNPEYVLTYDFLMAAAHAVLDDPAVAEKIGTNMRPMSDSSQPSPPVISVG